MAMDALQHDFQEQAAAGTGSDLDEWLQILADAGIKVFPMPTAPPDRAGAPNWTRSPRTERAWQPGTGSWNTRCSPTICPR